ncbi:MAG: ATP-binding protein [Candidatus Aegiribacteria sp.]|nr:ATP-binding protein [Candidatus Aegiribacteria sp.]
MRLDFLNRHSELKRLEKAFSGKKSSFVCLYGRRRCGKTRLLRESLKVITHVYYSGAKRERSMQLSLLAREISRLLPGFDRVEYPGWDELLQRWFKDSPPGAVLVLDEFPWIVEQAPELPGILQEHIDRDYDSTRHFAICGSSQRMMMGLLLDASAPLYGRATELIRLAPMGIEYLVDALNTSTPRQSLENWAVWGGIPRYWEIASDFDDLWEAVSETVLDPLGVFHREPERLLLDDMRDIVQPLSILSLIGRGSHRISEIAGRLGKQATSISRPISRLQELNYVERRIPFGQSPLKSKLSYYNLKDSFLRFWFRFVEPEMSLLESGGKDLVMKSIRISWDQFLGYVWEDLARISLPRIIIDNRRWGPASGWWSGRRERGIELDVVSANPENERELLIGEVKLRVSGKDIEPLLGNLRNKVNHTPFASGAETIRYRLFVLDNDISHPEVISGEQIITACAGSDN